ncbi:uncharacterized protein [Misgurnus anguillicaudatus]|uniref:uncharacterized protein isoform X1 n=1 Tax=Misgurnus anguillicaudatus TaxID=75329 RepID=UPI003CCF9885
MVRSCLVPGCSPKTRKGRAVSFHHLPVKDWERCKQWLRAINHLKYREDTDAVHLKNLTVCSRHFKLDDWELNVLGMKRTALKDTAIPSIFTFPDDEQPRPSDIKHIRHMIAKDLPLLASGQSSLTKKPSTQTPEKIQANPESDRRLAKTIIDIGSAFALWQKFRDEHGFKTDTELAFYLLRRTACCADLSARCKKRKLDPLTDVASEECESESSQHRNGHHQVPSPSQTVEPAQTEIKSKDQLGSEDQLRLENQIKQEDQMRLEDRINSEDQLRSENQSSVAPALNKEDIVPESSTSAIKNKIKVSHFCLYCFLFVNNSCLHVRSYDASLRNCMFLYI